MNSKLIVLLCLILLMCCKSTIHKERYVQNQVNYIPYYLGVYQADSLYKIDKINESYNLYKTIFSEYRPLNRLFHYEYENFLKAAYLSKNYEPIDSGVIALVKDYGLPCDSFEEDDDWRNILRLSGMDSLDCNRYRKEYLNKINLSIRDSIRTMIERDQLAIQKYNADTIQTNFQHKLRIQKKNSDLIKYIFENYGFPNIELIGNYSIGDGFFKTNPSIILLHTPFDQRKNYFLPKILDFIKKGKADPLIYAQMTDQMMYSENGYQIYGTFGNAPIKDSSKLNSLRRSIGLPSINFQME